MCAKSGLIYEKAKKGEKTNAKAMGGKRGERIRIKRGKTQNQRPDKNKNTSYKDEEGRPL